ncbi:DUF1269 domain-containing protein [Chelativorans sp. Marseille-P2723]|uniref:DUF1269 domain-containing protein n=1 Tax=Chelativorans sp. Marseille-P2723 TaxID=2709133 RepID=UPI00156D40B2|nr:DUF1269 domain-containing protein [Chelativorans sp. Marseille-P2723]
MAELVVVGFDSPTEADRVLTELSRLQKEHLVDLEDAVVVSRDEKDKLYLKQAVNLVGAGAVSGGLWGGLWGALVGLLFLNPMLGLISGGILGAGAGALSGRLADYGINDDFIRSIGETLKAGNSALFLLVRKVQPEKVFDELSEYSGRVIHTSLSPEQESRLREAIESSGVALPGSIAQQAE